MFRHFAGFPKPPALRAASSLGTAAILVAVVLLALFLGLICAVYPASFVAKLGFVGLGVLFVVFAFSAARRADSTGAGATGRFLINLWVFLLGACPSYLPFKFGPLPGLNPLRVAFSVVLAAWIYGLITSARLRESLISGISHSRLVFVLLTGFVAWQFLCGFIGEQPVFSTFQILRVVVPAYLIYLIALTLYRNWGDMQRTALWLALGALVACIAALIESKTKTNLFLAFFPSDPEQLAGLEWILVDKGRGGDYRVSATFAHPLVLAEYLCMALPLVVMLALTVKRPLHRALAWAFLPLLGVAIYLSFTRSSLIASVTSLLALAILFGIRSARQRKRPALAMAGWMIGVVTVLVAVILSSSIGYLARGRNTTETGSSDARVYMLQRGRVLMEDHPIEGYGPGLSAFKLGLLPGQRKLTIDSYYLSLAIESGYVGALLFLSGMALAMCRALLAGLRTTGVSSWVPVTVALSILASLIIKSVLSLDHNLVTLFLMAGMAVVASRLAGLEFMKAQGDRQGVHAGVLGPGATGVSVT